MSLAGPHGEGACPDCKTLVDLNSFKRIGHHCARRTPEQSPMPCSGIGAEPLAEQEVTALAFSSEVIMRYCPACRTDTPINTVGVDDRGRRFQPHRVGRPDGTTFYCPNGGLLVEEVQKGTVTVTASIISSGPTFTLGI